MSSGILRITLFTAFLAASAFGSAVPGTIKVVVRADTRLTDQAFESVGAIRIQDYDAFRVYRVPSATLANLQATAKNLGESIEIHDEWNNVVFRSRSIDARLAVDIRNAANDPTATDELKIYVIQFSSPLTAADEQLLTGAGARYLGYIPSNAVLVAAHGRALVRATANAPRVEWVSAYARSLKPSIPGAPFAGDQFVVQFANTSETLPHIQEFLSKHEVLQVSSYPSTQTCECVSA